MNRIASLYGINAVSYLSNVAAIFVFLTLSGRGGYGTYGIYIVFFAFFQVLDFALVKVALVVFERHRSSRGENQARALAIGFLNRALVPISALSIPFILAGDALFPYDPGTGVGGRTVAMIVVGEYILTYPANRTTFHLALEQRFQEIQLVRLAATLLRHLFAWSVLLMTGSLLLAMLAIVLKGVAVGLIARHWNERTFVLADLDRSSSAAAASERNGELLMLAGIAGTAFLLIIVQELPAVYIDRTYGRAALGSFRVVYDLVAVVWFVAAIYPTVLFSYLLPSDGVIDSDAARRALQPLSDLIGVFHVCYFLGVTTLLCGGMLFVGREFDEIPFAFGVVGGVAILGYNRFLIEAAQAYGQTRSTILATVVTVGVVLAILMQVPGNRSLPEVALAWVVGQAMLMMMLKAVLAKVVRPTWGWNRDFAIVLMPIVAVVLLQKVLPLSVLAAACLMGTIIAGIALLVLAINTSLRKGLT